MSTFLKNIHPLLKRTKGRDEHHNTNHAILNTLDTLLNEAEEDALQADVQTILHKATGRHLGIWGQWFGVSKRKTETEAQYRKRIIQRVDVPRGTKKAIQAAVKDSLGDPYVRVDIYEPWVNMFTLNQSKLNGDDYLMGEFYNVAVIEITIGSRYHEDLFKLIDDYKPAGVTVHIKLDLSLGSEDPNALPDINPTIHLESGQVERVLTRALGVRDELRGAIRIRDHKGIAVGELFTTNFSELNLDDRLVDPYTHRREEHVISYGGDYHPAYDMRLTDVLAHTTAYTEMEVIQPNTPASLYTYFTFNVGDVVYRNHPNKRLTRDHATFSTYVEGSAITLKVRGGAVGSAIRLQGYNHLTKTWAQLGEVFITSTEDISYLYARLPNMSRYLSQSLYTSLRVTGGLGVEYVDVCLEYRTDATHIENVRDRETVSFYGRPGTALTIDELTGLIAQGHTLPDGYIYVER